MSPSRSAGVMRGLPLAGAGLLLAVLYGWISFERSGAVEIRSFPSSVFRMDVFRAPRDWTTTLPSGRTSVHPLTKLLLTPVGLALRRNLAFAGDPVNAARVLSLAGVVIGALLAGLLAAQLAGDPRIGALGALVVGTSFSSVLLAAIPESASLACVATLAPLCFLCARDGRRWTALEGLAWAGLGLLGIAITVTQLAHWGIALAFRLHGLRSVSGEAPARLIARGAALLLLVLGLAAAGSWLQAERYPGSRKFYEVAAVAEDERAFLRLGDLRIEPFTHLARVSAHFVGVNFVAPYPARSDALIREQGAQYWILTVEAPWQAEWSAGQAALAAAVLLAIGGGVLALLRGGANRAFVPALLSVAAMFALHVLYGHEYLLYAGHWHGVVVALGLAAAWRAWPRRRTGLTAASLVLAVGLAANAVSVMDRVYAELDHGLHVAKRDAEGRPHAPLVPPARAADR